MNPREYQLEAIKFKNNDLTHNQSINNWLMGMIGEFGELVDILKKIVFHSHPVDKEKLSKEIGDVFWYSSVFAHDNDIDFSRLVLNPFIVENHNHLVDFCFEMFCDLNSLVRNRHYNSCLYEDLHEFVSSMVSICYFFNFVPGEIMEQNIKKLSARYPAGFSPADSINRVENKVSS